ncbi:MAG TPA: hypothetical protein VN845_13145 [Solirubrobacteraceae bacterium]|nr:hypothetical protein [Solirubrobacteraceae bacterium]
MPALDLTDLELATAAQACRDVSARAPAPKIAGQKAFQNSPL